MATKTMNISLPSELKRFIEGRVRSGLYGNASDVVRAGLRLLEEEETRLAAVRAALVEGERSGPARPFNVEAFLRRKRKSKAA